MRKTLSDRSEVAHYWANKVQPEGKAGNMFYVGDKIYSYGYHFCIARHVPGFVVMTTRGYSSSTGQHIAKVRQAARHLATVYCVDPDASAGANREQSTIRINNALIASEKKGIRQTTIDKCKGEALHHAEQFNAYLAVLPKVERVGVKPIDTAKLDQFRAAMVRQAKAEARKRAQAIKAQAIEAAAHLIDWRNGGIAYGLHSLPVALRLNGDNVETSYGARIPVADALTLWPIIERVRKGTRDYTPGMPLGVYQLTQIKQNGDIVVGCHNIAYSEIASMSIALGVAA